MKVNLEWKAVVLEQCYELMLSVEQPDGEKYYACVALPFETVDELGEGKSAKAALFAFCRRLTRELGAINPRDLEVNRRMLAGEVVDLTDPTLPAREP